MPQTTHYSGEFESGRLSISDASATQLPEVRCKWAVLRAEGAVIALGGADTVTATTGFSLPPGSVLNRTVEIPVDNLSSIWAIAAGPGAELEWMVVR